MRSSLVFALSAAATLLSCADKRDSSIVIALSSEAPVPDGVESIHIEVNRGGRSFYNQIFSTRAPEAVVDPKSELSVKDIPGTLTLRDDGEASGPVTVSVTATMRGRNSDGTQLSARRVARVAFLDEKQRLLRMPIQLACAALGDTCAKAGQSCRAGQCVDDSALDGLDQGVEDADSAAVKPVPDQCFKKDVVVAQETVDVIPIEKLGAELRSFEGQATVPGLFPSLTADQTLLDELRKAVRDEAFPTSASTPPPQALSDLTKRINDFRNQTNMGFIWNETFVPGNKSVTDKETRWTVVDRDPLEGWRFVHDADLTEAEVATLILAVRDVKDPTGQPALSVLKDDTLLTERLRELPEFRIVVSPGLEEVLARSVEASAKNQNPWLLGTLEQRGAPSKGRSQPICAPVAASK